MAKPPHVCTQRALPADLMRFQVTARRGGTTRAIIPLGKLWMNGSTLRMRFIGGTAAQRVKVKEQAARWTQFANLMFDFNDAPNAEIRIAFNANDGAWSYVGTDNRGIPLDQPTMNLGFMDGGTVAHEFGHAIGLAHEHQNPAGGIEWNEAMVRHNVLNKYSVEQVNGTSFDADSIEAGAKRRTSASIGKVGEEDLFWFNVKAGGPHFVDTRGPTDVVMKLFGPDSPTNVIAEDDDSGVATNALIRADLIPGRYYVQVRHYNRASGMGNCTVKARRA